jgi:hypothetical protein
MPPPTDPASASPPEPESGLLADLRATTPPVVASIATPREELPVPGPTGATVFRPGDYDADATRGDSGSAASSSGRNPPAPPDPPIRNVDGTFIRPDNPFPFGPRTANTPIYVPPQATPLVSGPVPAPAAPADSWGSYFDQRRSGVPVEEARASVGSTGWQPPVTAPLPKEAQAMFATHPPPTATQEELPQSEKSFKSSGSEYKQLKAELLQAMKEMLQEMASASAHDLFKGDDNEKKREYWEKKIFADVMNNKGKGKGGKGQSKYQDWWSKDWDGEKDAYQDDDAYDIWFQQSEEQKRKCPFPKSQRLFCRSSCCKHWRRIGHGIIMPHT